MRPHTPKRLPAFILPALVLLVSLLPNRLDLWFQDRLGQLLAQAASDDIVIVAIDEKSLAELGRWPWPRELLAGAIDKLGNARAVGLDLVLAEPSANPESDQALVDALRRNGKVFLPAVPEVSNNQLVETLPLRMFADAAKGIGMMDYPLDQDGLIRRTYLASGLGQPRWPGFTALLAGLPPPVMALDTPVLNNRWQRHDERLLPHLDGELGFPSLSFVDILNHNGNIEALAGKTVLIGATASGLGDSHLTPMQADWPATSGVVINAATTQALQSQSLVRPLDAAYLPPLLLGLTLLWQCLLRRRYREKSIHAVAIYSAALLAGAVLLLQLQQLYLPLASLITLLMLATVTDYFLQQSHFKRLALTDKLTGLANRHHFDDRFIFTLQQAQLTRKPLALLIIDVDYFKRYNDHYGHAAGDDVLKKIATVVEKAVRNSHDLAARIGGEEFAILLPGATPEQALDIAATLRQQLLLLQIPHQQSPVGRASCSIGVLSQVPQADDTTRSLFEQADKALYAAKHNGRDRAEIAN
ncbi:diguanylate cyclase [Vogesella indigofera]|uniref:diguanylate cyclase n=1 Tax=Vogesella indigofera TaxID=45465 RepID=A0ABT5I3P8_VOGIN|nr:CHASE2 domain-containing protein [Vogesella indigofera]MDC7690658.1 diguanylate cyclase [Vogesella indigofera]